MKRLSSFRNWFFMVNKVVNSWIENNWLEPHYHAAAPELRGIRMNFYLINPDAEHRGILLIKKKIKKNQWKMPVKLAMSGDHFIYFTISYGETYAFLIENLENTFVRIGWKIDSVIFDHLIDLNTDYAIPAYCNRSVQGTLYGELTQIRH